MKIYGGRIVQARQLRGLSRRKLAAMVQMKTAELREVERTHALQECGCCPVEVDVPESLVTRLTFTLRFPRRFFFNVPWPFPDARKIFWCQNPDGHQCVCGQRGTRLCDFVIKTRDFHARPARDVETTCDAPICDDCTERTGEVDYCPAHASKP